MCIAFSVSVNRVEAVISLFLSSVNDHISFHRLHLAYYLAIIYLTRLTLLELSPNI